MGAPLDRRAFLRLGLGSALAATLGLPLLSRRAGAGPAPRARACVLLYLHGGPSHIDTFDPKPGAPTGGPFAAIDTAVPGLRFSEHLPLLAARAEHLAVVRSVTSREGSHARARYLARTGFVPQAGVDHPSLGALAAEARPPRALPGYVAVAGEGHGPGYAGAAHAPFPVRDPRRPVRHLEPPRHVDARRHDDRMAIWRGLEDGFAAGRESGYPAARRAAGEAAAALTRSVERKVFDLASEPAPLRDAYGDGPFGQGCLLARRLVEAGVPFVEVALPGWDTHVDNFPRVQRLCGALDRGASVLLDDLRTRGLLDSTLVVVMGEFGRTPRINERGGRDHHARAWSAVLAGGGVRGGQAVGATDELGDRVAEHPVTIPDLFRTLASLLGLDPDRIRTTPAGRPVPQVDGGTLITQILR